MENEQCGFCAAVETWFQQPFKSTGNTLDWFLFGGLVFVIIWFWSRILVRIAP